MYKLLLVAALIVTAATANAQRADLTSPGYYTVTEAGEKTFHEDVVTGVLTMSGLRIVINGVGESFIVNETVEPQQYKYGEFDVTRLAFTDNNGQHTEIEFSVNVIEGQKVIFCNIIQQGAFRSFAFFKKVIQTSNI